MTAPAENQKFVDYLKNEVPDYYRCGSCGATDCKLWREFSVFKPRLKCADCAAKDARKDVTCIDENGSRPDDTMREMRTDQIGWWVPAVPTEDIKGGYWGATSLPEAAVEWWKKLPTRPNLEKP